MYERSAIVLERYFNNILGYFSENNLKVNFENYCSLIDKLDKYQYCYSQEETAIQDFEDVTDRLKTIQKQQEKIYKKSAKLEFNRNILFNNIENDVKNIEHCMIKIENDIDKNIETLKQLRNDYINTLNEYNQKNGVLIKSKKSKKNAENTYIDVLESAQENIDNINEFILEVARNFNRTEIKENLLKLMLDNGKNEKIPFDEEVINLAADLGMDITNKEVECYVDAYDSIIKLFVEIDSGEIKIEKFKRKLKNSKAVLNFLAAVKEYLVQFLDYERMMSVSGKKTHKQLMEQACERFRQDIIQINNLYELMIKETTNKATQKLYKELYNKSYLLEINKEEADLRKEKNKINSAVATVLGSNYWRIEGIKNIYTVFYKEISETFRRDLDEFDIPEEEVELDIFDEEVEILKTEVEISKPEVKESLKVIEEIEEEELPKLISEEDMDFEASVEPIIKEVKIIREKHDEIIDSSKIELHDEEDIEYSNEVKIIEEVKPKRRGRPSIAEKIKSKEKEEKVSFVEEAESDLDIIDRMLDALEENIATINEEKDKFIKNEEKIIEVIESITEEKNEVSQIETVNIKEIEIAKPKRKKDIVREESQKIELAGQMDSKQIEEVVKEQAKIELIKETTEEESKVELIEEIAEEERKVELIEEIAEEENKVEIVQEVKTKRRRDIIKEEEEEKKKEKAKVKAEELEKKKEKSKIKEESRKKKIEKIEVVENIIEEKADITEEVKPKRRRKDIIREEEEKKKEKAKIKSEGKRSKNLKTQIIEKTEEVPEEKNKNEIEENVNIEESVGNKELDDVITSKTNFFEEEINDIDELETAIETIEGDYEIDTEVEEESLFGNIKNTKESRRKNLDLDMLEQLGEKNKNHKKGIFSSLINLNSKKGKRVAD